MKSKLIIFLSILILGSCDTTEDRPDCSAISCDFVSKPIKIRYVDKATNKSLLAPGSPYTLADLIVTGRSNSNYSPEVKIDLNDPSVIIVRPVFGGEVLTLGNLSPDVIDLKTKVGGDGNDCCPPIDVTALIINGVVICAPCTDLNQTIAVIKK